MEPDEIRASQERTIPLILEEVLRQRKDQDDRLEYLRRIAGLFLSIFIPGSALVVFNAFRLDEPINPYAAGVAAGLLIFGLLATLAVLGTRRWKSGPDIRELIDGPFQQGLKLHLFQRILVLSHDEGLQINEHQVRKVQRWLTVAMICFVFSTAALGVGLSR